MKLKERVVEDMKAALRAKETARLSALRLLLAAIKQREVDERVELGDAEVVAVIDKMLKQRRESISQYRGAGREDLAAVEEAELAIILAYLPEALSDEEIAAMVSAAIAETGAAAPADMGKVMAVLKPKMQGRADMSAVSAIVKQRLSS